MGNQSETEMFESIFTKMIRRTLSVEDIYNIVKGELLNNLQINRVDEKSIKRAPNVINIVISKNDYNILTTNCKISKIIEDISYKLYIATKEYNFSFYHNLKLFIEYNDQFKNGEIEINCSFKKGDDIIKDKEEDNNIKPCLIVKNDKLLCNKPMNFIGRIEENDIIIDDPSISRKHAIIYTQGKPYILDLMSTNGILYNNKRVERIDLSDKITFTLGNVECIYSYEEIK